VSPVEYAFKGLSLARDTYDIRQAYVAVKVDTQIQDLPQRSPCNESVSGLLLNKKQRKNTWDRYFQGFYKGLKRVRTLKAFEAGLSALPMLDL
jgi:hypothetical protein